MNSYKRLVPGYEAPVYIAWSRRNRSALVRVPLYHPGQEKATRAELRCPDPAANIYLCFAALLHAGLEGIEKGYELPEPMERNLYNLTVRRAGEDWASRACPPTSARRSRRPRTPSSCTSRLGEHVFTRLLELKRAEFEDYRVQVTPYEMEKYPADFVGSGFRFSGSWFSTGSCLRGTTASASQVDVPRHPSFPRCGPRSDPSSTRAFDES